MMDAEAWEQHEQDYRRMLALLLSQEEEAVSERSINTCRALHEDWQKCMDVCNLSGKPNVLDFGHRSLIPVLVVTWEEIMKTLVEEVERRLQQGRKRKQ